MRIRRTILAPAILLIGTTGVLAAGPVLAVTASTTPVAAALASGSAKPNMVTFGG